MTTKEKNQLVKLGQDYLPVFVKHNGDVLRSGTASSREAIRKTARELDLTQSHVRAAICAYAWG